MSADRFYAAQSGHIAVPLPPVDITGGKTSACFSMRNHSHVTLIIAIGVSAAAPGAITLKACTDNTGAGATAIDFTVFKQETAAGDVLSAAVAADPTGVTPPATDNIFYVIELDANELPDGKPFVRVDLADTANSVLATVVAVFSGARFAGDQNDTVLS